MSALVTLAQAKEHIRISNDAVNDQITLLLNSVEDWVARKCATLFSTAAQVEEHHGDVKNIEPFVRPIVSITKVRDLYMQEDMDATYYRLTADKRKIQYVGTGCVPISWPDTDAYHRRYEVTYVGGYNDGDTVKPVDSSTAPVGLRLAVLGLVRRAYEVRGGQVGQSGQGFSVQWDTLADGEIMSWLRPYLDERWF